MHKQPNAQVLRMADVETAVSASKNIGPVHGDHSTMLRAAAQAGEKDHFLVGTDEQVAVAESADALEHIQSLASKLSGDDITAALNVVICDTQMPAFKRKYLEKSGSLCPFCESSGLSSGPIQSDGPVAWCHRSGESVPPGVGSNCPTRRSIIIPSLSASCKPDP